MIEYSENLNKLKNNLITHKDYHPLLQKISLPRGGSGNLNNTYK